MASPNLQEVQHYLDPILGQKPWSVWLGMGSLLTLEFGKAREQQTRRRGTILVGEWRLWIYMAAWRLETADVVLIGSEDPRPKIQRELKHLEDVVLRSVNLVAPSLETHFIFERGIILNVFPVYSEHEDHWMLFAPDGYVLTIGPASTWSYARADMPLDV